jgi:hypothetical protein
MIYIKNFYSFSKEVNQKAAVVREVQPLNNRDLLGYWKKRDILPVTARMSDKS